MSIRSVINNLREIFNMPREQISLGIGEGRRFQGVIQSVETKYVRTQLHGSKGLYFIEARDNDGRTAKMILPVNAQGRDIVPMEGALIETDVFKDDKGWNRYVRQDPESWLGTNDFKVLDYRSGNVAKATSLSRTGPR